MTDLAGSKLIVAIDQSRRNLLGLRTEVHLPPEMQERYDKLSREEQRAYVMRIRSAISAMGINHSGHIKPFAVFMSDVLLYDEPITRKELFSAIAKLFQAKYQSEALLLDLAPLPVKIQDS